MTATRVQSEYTFKATWGGGDYYWEVVIDAQGLASVRNVRAPTGLIRDTVTNVPEPVVDDIHESVNQVQAALAESAAYTGLLTFTGQTSQLVALPGGLLNNTEYRVVYSPPDTVEFRTLSKTTTTFVADAGVAYGSPTEPKDVGYVVLVATAQASTFGGSVVFDDTSSTISVTFGTVFETSAYRVLLSFEDFVTARVTNQTTLGFDIELGISLLAGETVEVGFDVFV
jgi:hypothetical protein